MSKADKKTEPHQKWTYRKGLRDGYFDVPWRSCTTHFGGSTPKVSCRFSTWSQRWIDSESLSAEDCLPSPGLSNRNASMGNVSGCSSCCVWLQKKPGLRRCSLFPYTKILGVDSHSFQPSFFAKTGCFPSVFDGFLKRRIPGKNENGRHP